VVSIFHYLNAAASLALAIAAALRMRRGGSTPRWGAAAFAVLALVMVAQLGERHHSAAVEKLIVCLLLAFPYLLLQFAASLQAISQRIAHVGTAALAIVVVATLSLPPLPQEGDPRPDWIWIWTVGVLVFWTALSVVTIAGLWRGTGAQPTLARRRTRLMSAATAGMNVLILLAGIGVTGAVAELVVQALLLVCLAAFAVGFAPPAIIRLAWRQPEQEALRHATQELVVAETVGEVTDKLLPHVARIVGASGASLIDEHGAVVAAWGDRPGRASTETVQLSPPFGAIVVATSPLTPFFGREEIELLYALGAVADLSLSRCALLEQERAGRSALQRAMEEAERANTAKSDFLSRMSHELRTPLNVVLGFGQLLEMRAELAPKDRESVEHIVKAGRHLLELINEVLDLSRIESGRMSISPEPVEVTELAGEALDLIRPLAAERDVRIAFEDGARRCYVTADRQRLKQVLLNLLSNAVKYNRDGGAIDVACREETPGRVRISVCDTGPGIPVAMMDRLFEPFERLGAERGRVEGTGLGLALSRQLVQLMDGHIGVDSREGEGSAFWIELATAQPHNGAGRAAPGDPGALEAGAPSRRRVLLVEDNLANLKLIEALTADRTHIELLPAMTGRLGLELAREHRPDMILLDHHLPDLTGAEVLHRLKAHPDTREIPVVIVSADATPGHVRRMLEIGAADYLTKPLDVPRFLRAIEGILEPARPELRPS
jgi:signal transduction histidine kinase/CheY-like chemotaxis protein